MHAYLPVMFWTSLRDFISLQSFVNFAFVEFCYVLVTSLLVEAGLVFAEDWISSFRGKKQIFQMCFT